eukprot:tig00000692_g3241.t1
MPHHAYGSRLEGVTLSSYHPTKGLVAFSKGTSLNAFLVFVPGLTDGLLSHDFLLELIPALNARGVTFVQPVLSSSYRQYGTSSLQKDAEELDELFEHLLGQAEGAGIKREDVEFYLMGHSTGTQDTVWFLKHARNRSRVRRAILQAPVSDRDYLRSLPGWEERAKLAAELVAAGQGARLLPGDTREADEAVPVTAYRWDSLVGRLGDDDMFSSDLTDAELRSRLGHVAAPTLLLFSLADEYVPAHVDARALAHRIRAALGGPSELVLVEGGRHALPDHADLLCTSVLAFISKPF